MANLIIKPTSGGSLILQDEGGTAAHTIDASGNHTLSGTTNNLGTVTAGTLGSAIVFNDAHKDIDMGVDGWYSTRSSELDLNSNAVFDFDAVTSGSNITESAGSYTIGRAGWYWMSTACSNHGGSAETLEMWLQKNGTSQGPRLYMDGANEINYLGQSMAWIFELAANDVIRLYGQGHIYGGATTAAMCMFTGFRLGA